MDKQKEILKYLATVKTASLKEIYRNIKWGYYANGIKHIGAILTRMVNNGKITRIKKGVFKINDVVVKKEVLQ